MRSAAATGRTAPPPARRICPTITKPYRTSVTLSRDLFLFLQLAYLWFEIWIVYQLQVIPLVAENGGNKDISAMHWSEPANSKKRVNWAGKVILWSIEEIAKNGIDDYIRASAIVNNWRSSHNFPLNTF